MRISIVSYFLFVVRSNGLFLPMTKQKSRSNNLSTLKQSSNYLESLGTSVNTVTDSTTRNEKYTARRNAKRSLLEILGNSFEDEKSDESSSDWKEKYDSVLACPETKEPIRIEIAGPYLSNSFGNKGGVAVKLRTKDSNVFYKGRSDTFFNLLMPEELEKDSSSSNNMNKFFALLPMPLRMQIGMLTPDDDFVPMRDLFTSPTVSFAYERGWRRGFNAAGFPGIEKEFDLVSDFFRPALDDTSGSVVVDMSCATGLMTRRFIESGEYSRVIGCDYSESMLTEARRRINLMENTRKRSSKTSKTKLELVQCDVAKIPMQNESINALHAGAAMHCWPDVQQGLKEIYRVLKPRARFFATTFLSDYFKVIQNSEGGAIGPQRQAFQYFESEDVLRNMLLEAGFDESKIRIEVLGVACVVMRCEK